jgi:hypothetical protein
MPTTSDLTFATDAVLAELDTHCECLRIPNLELDEFLAIRNNLAGSCLRGLIVIYIHLKIHELQLDEIVAEHSFEELGEA